MKVSDVPARPTRIGISVKLTPEEHEALRALVWAEGHTSFQSYFRSLAVQKLKAAQAGQEAPDACGVN